MNHKDLDEFLKRLAPDTSTGWEWLRAMHEAGYTYLPSNSTDYESFTHGNEAVCAVTFAGRVTWVASWPSRAGRVNEVNGYRFDTPMAAHAWMKVEQSNEPATEAKIDPLKQAGKVAWPGGSPPPTTVPQPTVSSPFVRGIGAALRHAVPVVPSPAQPWPTNPHHGQACNGYVWDNVSERWLENMFP